MTRRGTQAYRQLIDDLERERLSGQVHRGYVSPAMQWGIDHEAPARRWYTKSHGRPVREIGFVVHPKLDFVGVSPDGMVDHDGLVEIKCPQMPNFQLVLDSREVPARYRWQVQGQLWVCQRDWLDFVCFYPPGQGVVIRVNGNQKDFDLLADRCHEINGEVEKRLRARFGANAPSHLAPVPRPAPAGPTPTRRPPSDEPLDYRLNLRKQESGGTWWIWVLLVLGALMMFNR